MLAYADNEEAQLAEPRYDEFAQGGFVSKGLVRECRSTQKIVAACAKMNSKYEDPDFSPAAMLNASSAKAVFNIDEIKFLRPCWKGQPDVREHLNAGVPPAEPPVLLLETGSVGVFKQGQLSDSWLLGAAATVASKPDLLSELLVDFSLDWGVFTFRIFKDGKWRHVTIDDRLPAHKETRVLLFAVGVDNINASGHQGARAQRVMWVSLFEKAYAKLHGCYQNLNKGTVPYALKDLTAGAPQSHVMSDETVRTKLINGTLWKQLVDWCKSGCLLSFCFTAGDTEAALSLRRGRCYPVLDLRSQEEGGQEQRLVRLGNPWANEAPYGGEWANDSANWGKFKKLSSSCRPAN